jgi:hypothetical protein
MLRKGSGTKVRDKEIRHLLGQLRDAARQEKGGPQIGKSYRRESSRPGTANDPPAPAKNGSSEDEAHGYSPRDDQGSKEQVFATLRREILAARLKVTLDEQLNRKTSPTVRALAQIKLAGLPGVRPSAQWPC